MQHRLYNIDETEKKKRNDITKPNTRSTNILANKFREEFVQVVSECASYQGEKYIDPETNLPLSLASHEYNYIMTNLGFAKENRVINQTTLKNGKKVHDAVHLAWDFLEVKHVQQDGLVRYVKTNGLYNFLCYL